MKLTAKDVFTTLYSAFDKLDRLVPPEEPDLTASKIEIEVYQERVVKAQKEVENTLDEGAKLLDRYIDSRIKRMILKMKYDGELK